MVILFQLDFSFRRKELRFRLRSWQVKPGQSSNEVRFFLSHFPSPRTSSKRIGPRVAPRLFCGDVPLVKVIRSLATDAVASKCMMNTTIGLASVAVAAPVAGDFHLPAVFSLPYTQYSLLTRCQELRRRFVERC